MIDSFRGPNRWLSNFHECKVEIDGMTFPSSEHAYMSYKSNDPNWKLTCQKEQLKPRDIKRLGREVKLDDPDWDNKRVYYMTKVLIAKFEQNPDLAEKLLTTGDEQLVEGNDWGDTYWGTVNGVGENHLGKILMHVRSGLKDQKDASHDK